MITRRVRCTLSLVCAAGLSVAPAIGAPLLPAVGTALTPTAAAQSDNFAEHQGAATNPAFPGGPTPQQAAALGLIPNPAPAYLATTIDSISPHVADGAPGRDAINGMPIVSVEVTIRNIASIPVDSVAVRLQRAGAHADPATLRTALSAPVDQFPVAGPFEPVADRLEPGDQKRVRLSLPLSAANDQPNFDITQPGVYPLLVNVNGTPQGLAPAQLSSARTLLPVLPDALRLLNQTHPDGADPAAQEPAENPASRQPMPVTMVLPIAAPPTRHTSIPGRDGKAATVQLVDDSLLNDLAPEGRLNGVLDALEQAERRHNQLNKALCLAIDPEMLRTVEDISKGYPVIIDGTDLGAQNSHFATAAADWLNRLRSVASQHCVIALPPAQADLAAVAGIDSPALNAAVTDGPTLEVKRILGVSPLEDVTVPATGTLNPEALPAFPQLKDSRVLLAANNVQRSEGSPPAGPLALAEGPTALTFDPFLATALAATARRPENPRYSVPEQRYWLQADSTEARLQDARAALLAPMLSGHGGQAPPGPPQPLLIMPPQVWDIDDGALSSFLDVLGTQLGTGTMTALPLAEAVSAPAAPGEPAHLDTSHFGSPITTDTLGEHAPQLTSRGKALAATGPDSDPGALDIRTLARIREAMQRLDNLRAIVDTADPSAADADAFLDPFRSEALRALTVTGRRAGGDGSIGSLEAAFGEETPGAGPSTGRTARHNSEASLNRLEQSLDMSFNSIELLPPGTVYQMASPNSPLLLVARNGLPFPIRVGVKVDTPPGVRVDTQGQIAVPASGSRTVQLPAESDSTGGKRKGITMQLTSAEGVPLSQPVRVSIQSGGTRSALVFTLLALASATALIIRRVIVVRRGRRQQEGTR